MAEGVFEVRGRVIQPGKAEGEVCYVERVGELEKEDFSGKILVALKHVPLKYLQYIPKVKGVVLTVGGLLSHVAILCWEMGIPAVLAEGEEEKKVLKKAKESGARRARIEEGGRVVLWGGNGQSRKR